MKKQKIVVSFSGGKDSTLSLYRMLKQNYEIIGLISTFDNDGDSCFHKIPKKVIEAISKSLNISLIEVNCTKGNIYEEEFEKALTFAKDKGAEICVFGDIDIEHHKKWGLDRCAKAGLEGVFPLWQQDRESLTNEFLDYGFKAIIKKVNLKELNEEFIGKELTKDVVNKIKENGADPSGENGEYHTLVFDGPIFKEKVQFEVLGKEIIGQYGYLTISNESC